MVDKSVIDTVRRYLQALQEHGLPIRGGVLFGSYVTGQATQWSDIDLIVISPRFDGVRQWEDIDLLWHLTVRTDSRIEPIPVGEHQWQEDDSSAIVEMARREGQLITLTAKAGS